ncbi:hypothetical protein M409DRAFT_16207 [Zasmidium cellare ATCC 36951]|uniref:N-acetyltransferase domain-containing protein n=1 Tax=Zasmidium cellare ATCC 36951 TaxID=1080233 RepID=A0A6A6D686_ZASCE|nr:uncharacterized protein M409DRAFT_16207 [Zasmidium cellare ATCC 36951]KAF2173938.1 hypothetical protein M409DRAFT_16207 [Zasmidium cellare ATCC 36951]
MPTPTITITPVLHPTETPTYITTFASAFTPPSADMLMPLIYPTGLQDPQVQAHLLATFDAPSKTNLLYLARDAETGAVLGCSGWEVFEADAEGEGDVEVEVAKTLAAAEAHPAPPELNRNNPLRRAAISAMVRSRSSLPKPFVELTILAVNPEQQGKGVGSALLRDGLNWVDEMKIPAFVVSSGQGRALYERYGFGEVWDFGLDAREFGGEREGRHWCMWRKARE